MKKVCAALLAVVTILCSVPCVNAVDVKTSKADYYEHEETGVSIPYRLVLPDSYDEKYQFPLVVFFHGAGERGYENERQLDNCVQQMADNMPKAIILVPQCTHSNQWVDTPWGEGSYSTDEVPESDEMIAVMDLIGLIMQDYSVDKNCVYAAGISMGGYAVWDAMIRHNEIFAAGVAVCGAGDPAKVEILKDTPMFVYHGTADDVVPVSGSVEMVEAIEAAGGTKVRYTEFAGSGHGIWGVTFDEVDLYRELKRCKLSDRGIDPYATDEKGKKEKDILPYVLAGGGVLLLAAVVTTALTVKRKKRSKT